MLMAGINVFKRFNRLADPGKDAKQNLTSLLTFLKRHFAIPVILYASTQVFVFIPGLLTYFFLVYGDVKYHERHIRICLSDLSVNALAQVSENIQLRRKQDTLIKFRSTFKGEYIGHEFQRQKLLSLISK